MSGSHVTHSLRGRLARAWQEIAKFGTVGVAGVVVNLVAFTVLRHEMQPVRAGVLATAIAIVFNYLGYRYWVYRHADKKSRSREISLFLVFSLIGLVIENGTLYAAVYWIGLHSSLDQIVAKNVVGLGLGTAFRFWSYRTWVWRLPTGHHAVEAAQEILATAERPTVQR